MYRTAGVVVARIDWKRMRTANLERRGAICEEVVVRNMVLSDEPSPYKPVLSGAAHVVECDDVPNQSLFKASRLPVQSIQDAERVTLSRRKLNFSGICTGCAAE